MRKYGLLLAFIVINFCSFAQDKNPKSTVDINSEANGNVIQICDILPNLNASNSICFTGNFSFSTATTGNYSYTGSPQANYGCLLTTPNQTWFVVTVSSVTSANQTLKFSFPNNGSFDIDAAVWGPIYQNDLANACASLYNPPLACDYDTSDPDLTIPNAIVGQKYLLVITNYANTVNTLQMVQPIGGSVQFCTPNCPAVPTPTIQASATDISCGQSVILTSAGCNATTTWSDGAIGSSRTVTPAKNTSYSAICSNIGCLSSTSNIIAISIQNLTVPTISASVSDIACGQSTTLTAAGCTGGTVFWSNGSTGTSITVSPNTQTSYTANCKIGNCSSPESDPKIINISNAPSPSINATLSTLTCGQSTTLSVSGCSGTLLWSSGSTSSTIAVSPASTAAYSVICTVLGCKSLPVTKTITVDAIAAPTVSTSRTSVLCGEPVILTASGTCTGTIKWSNGTTGSSVTVNPKQTTTYRAVCLGSTCSSQQSAGVLVTMVGSAAPSISAGTTSLACGQGTTLTAANCSGTVNWSDGAVGATVTVTPYQNTSYSATCVDAAGCKSEISNVVDITIASAITPSISASVTSITCGQTVTLTAAGCGTGTINWSSGNVGSPVSVTPVRNTIYTATCTNNSCTGGISNAIEVSVSNNIVAPIITLSSTTVIGCISSTVLTASGCTGTVLWSNGSTGTSITVSPAVQTIYTAKCSVTGCVSGDSNAITVVIALDNDNTYQTATDIPNSPYTSPTLGICPTGDADWFKIRIYNRIYYVKVKGYSSTTQGSYALKFSNNSGGIELETIYPTGITTSTDTFLELYDSNGTTLIASNDDSGDGAFSKISYCFPSLNLTHMPDDYINQSNVIVQRASKTGRIIATNWIQNTPTNVTYEAGVVELNPGFIADTGTVFLAKVGGCNTASGVASVEEKK